jgi:hypothetical protein
MHYEMEEICRAKESSSSFSQNSRCSGRDSNRKSSSLPVQLICSTKRKKQNGGDNWITSSFFTLAFRWTLLRWWNHGGHGWDIHYMWHFLVWETASQYMPTLYLNFKQGRCWHKPQFFWTRSHNNCLKRDDGQQWLPANWSFLVPEDTKRFWRVQASVSNWKPWQRWETWDYVAHVYRGRHLLQAQHRITYISPPPKSLTRLHGLLISQRGNTAMHNHFFSQHFIRTLRLSFSFKIVPANVGRLPLPSWAVGINAHTHIDPLFEKRRFLFHCSRRIINLTVDLL